MIKLAVLLACAALACHAYPSASDSVNHLYNTVVSADYDTALDQTKNLVRQGNGNLVKQTVDRLIKNSIRNTVEYAYKLWTHGAQDIVRERFPNQFRLIFGESKIKLVFHRDNLAIKLGDAYDDMGDRVAYGDANDKTSERVSWKFLPHFEDNRVYVKIFNNHRRQYLKDGEAVDSLGDHNVYGDGKSDTHRHQFYLQPASLNGELLFYIFNRQYNQVLKLGRAVDSQGDRTVYSHQGTAVGNPELWGWYVTAW